MNITDIPVGGCRRYETLECRSNVPYQAVLRTAYWVYTSNTLEDHHVDDIRCNMTTNRCRNSDIGWWSRKGIYKKGKRYYGLVRLGKRFENATVGRFTCHYEGDIDSPVSVNIIASEFYTSILGKINAVESKYQRVSRLHHDTDTLISLNQSACRAPN